MLRKYFLIIFFLVASFRLITAQTFTDSNLPIIIINTDGGAEIPDDPRILATMKIIYRGEGLRNYVSDQNAPEYLNYNGRIDIELRGSSSQAMDKKAYGLSTKMADGITNNNVSVLGLPADNDWILNNNVFDPSMIRNYLSYTLSRMIGQYASRTVFCELVINGEYMGLYLLLEKIKPGKDRVDIHKIGTDDNSFPDVTGGYITKSDKTTGGDPVAWYMSSYNWTNDIAFIHDKPEPDEVTAAQNYYIKSCFFKLSDAASANDQSLLTGYPSVIDVPSFIDYLIINELASNADAYSLSTYYHKDKMAKLRAGPIWDMDLTYGNDLFIWGYDRSKTYVWQFSDGGNDGPRYWTDLFRNAKFRCYLSRRWNSLIAPGQPFNYNTIETLIDQTVAVIKEAVVRENQKWGTVGDHAFQISALKSWLQERITWITNNIGSYSGCSDPVLPSLVITKIMYAPDTSAAYTVSKDLEFLEITNTGYSKADLTGVYFMGTGFVYDFLPNSSINAGESIILAGKSETFITKYGFIPFGQFNRNLSDTGENLVLADGFGNVIDEVDYTDQPPWPDASFNGYYIRLIDNYSDNNVGSNWIADRSTPVTVHDIETEPDLKIYPSPVRDVVYIESDTRIISVEICNISGTRLRNINVSSNSCSINISSFPSGMFIIRTVTQGKNILRKIIKD